MVCMILLIRTLQRHSNKFYHILSFYKGNLSVYSEILSIILFHVSMLLFCFWRSGNNFRTNVRNMGQYMHTCLLQISGSQMNFREWGTSHCTITQFKPFFFNGIIVNITSFAVFPESTCFFQKCQYESQVDQDAFKNLQISQTAMR